MKTIFIYIMILFSLGSSVFCQNYDTCSQYVILAKGPKLCGKTVLKDPFLARMYISFNDSVRYELNQVRSYHNTEGSFYNIPVYNREPGNDRIIKRVQQGRIDWYEEWVTYMTPSASYSYKTPGGTMTNFTPGSVTSARLTYFSKGNSPILKSTRGNLMKYMDDNETSMSFLRTHRNLNYAKVGLVLTGLGMVAYGLSKIDKKDGLPKSSINLMIAGTVITNISWIFQWIQNDCLEKAITHYNQSEKK